MVAKRSIEDTKGEEGVRIVKNEPFEDEEHGKGQYTEKIIYVAESLKHLLSSILHIIF